MTTKSIPQLVSALIMLSLVLQGSIMGFAVSRVGRRGNSEKIRSHSFSFYKLQASTVEAPTRPDTERKTSRKAPGDGYVNDDIDDSDEYGDLEYLIDSSESREMDDPFHILLMGSTFEKPKITVSYVSGSLEYVLGMPLDEAKELSFFAQEEGFSCLGTWSREECLSFGKQLQRRDIVCRVVPFAEGGQRGWQAKNAKDGVSSNDLGAR